jgi:hypothetical protein
VPAPKYNEHRVFRHRIALIANQNKLYFKILDSKFATLEISENFQRISEFESLNNRITTNSLGADNRIGPAIIWRAAGSADRARFSMSD